MRARSFWRGGCLSSAHRFAPPELPFDGSADEISTRLPLPQHRFDTVERPGRQPRRGVVLVYARATHRPKVVDIVN
jgi:hypothetical protein